MLLMVVGRTRDEACRPCDRVAGDALGAAQHSDWGAGVVVHYGSETFYLRMDDASMAPRFEAGVWLYVDPDEPAEAGRYVGIEDPRTGMRTARLMVEEGGRRVLRALDDGWPEIVLDHDNETMILGTVVFGGSRP